MSSIIEQRKQAIRLAVQAHNAWVERSAKDMSDRFERIRKMESSNKNIKKLTKREIRQRDGFYYASEIGE